MSAVSAGDHLLVSDSAYRPTRIFCDEVLARFGVETTYYDPLVGAGIADLMRENTKAVLVEAPGSLTFEMQDIPAIAQAVHARDACVIMDNTWATPLLFPPHERASISRSRPAPSISAAARTCCSASPRPTPNTGRS